MKKIMFHISTLSYGGAERVIVNLANQFSNAGYDVVMVNSFKSEKEYIYSDKIRRMIMFEGRISGFIKRNIAHISALRKLVKREKPDVLVSFMAEPNFRALLSCVGLKTKNLISIRNDPDKEYPTTVSKLCAKILYNLADGVVFQTQDASKWFSKKIRHKSRIIYNQVDEKFFSTSLGEERKDIVTVGRFALQKNHELLISAFSKISESICDNLIIYGEGDKRKDLEELVSKLELGNRVFLPGAVKNVQEVLSKSKIFVLSSDYEGMPNALIEAMTVGLPCISTDCPCGGPRELFDNEKNGLLVPINDVDALAEKMLYLINDPDKQQELGKNAKIASEKFSPERVFREWEGFALKIT